MAQHKTLVDEFGILFEANQRLPQELLSKFPAALAELEDEQCHRSRSFPKTRLHKIEGVKASIYRADIDKTSGWRLHIQYQDQQLHLKDLLAGQQHDLVLEAVRAKKHRYR